MLSKKGFSLVELMVILAALGGIALLVTKLGRNSVSIQNEAIVANDYNDLNREAHFLIENPKSCKVSLEGTVFQLNSNPIIIKKLELWSADSRGLRRKKKKYSSSEKVGSLTIEDISLALDKEANTKIESDIQSTTGTLKISLAKMKSKFPLSDIEQSINISFKTDINTGTSTIINCENISDKKGLPQVWCGEIQNPCGAERLQVVAVGNYEEGKFTGVLESSVLTDVKYCHSAVKFPANFRPCGN